MLDPKTLDDPADRDVVFTGKLTRAVVSKNKPGVQRQKRESIIDTKLAFAHTPIALAAARSLPIIDKLELVLPRELMTDYELDQAGERLKHFKSVKKRSSKGDSYKRMYVLTCPSGAKVVFSMVPGKADMRFGMKITMNPVKMTLEDVRAFYECLRQLFLPDWKAMVAAMLLRRVDQAYDHPVRVEHLIVQLVGSPTEQKYLVRNDRGGVVQAWYCGSIESRLRWIMYDQFASDVYKLEHNELPSRPKARDDAEMIIEGKRDSDVMTRLEARRIFDKPMTLREADAQRQPLGHFNVYLIDDTKLASAPKGFASHLDSIRVRGVAGAGKYYREHNPGREGSSQLSVFNKYLESCIAPFWPKSGLNSCVEDALSKLPLWNVLKHLALSR